MSGLGGLNKSAHGVVVGLVQLQLPVVQTPAIMCTFDGPEVAAFKKACLENRIWACFSIMELNPAGNPYNSGLIIDDAGKSPIRRTPFAISPRQPASACVAVMAVSIRWAKACFATSTARFWCRAVTDGSSCGFAAPTRNCIGPESHPLVPDAAAMAKMAA